MHTKTHEHIYAREDASEQNMFKTMFRNKVQKNFKEMLSHTYEFFWVIPTETVEQFVETYYYRLNGRVYIPHWEEKRLLMALEWKVPKEESSDECIKMKAFLEEKGARIEAFEL